ncbi:clavesin-1 isoform X2 [Manduca sexta]|nr:clavesin-1 isoform X2 [Manduca sexta]XP_030023307.2 clavesin-1 isoform X2 [Manduca sexta]
MALKQISIQREYEKNPEISPEDIGQLREWLATQPHLPGELLTDLDLLLVYHCCERSMQVSKQVLDLHYTLRTMFTQFFHNRSVDKKIEFTLDTVLICPLPTRSTDGNKVIYARLLDNDPRNFFFPDIARAFMMIFDLLQYEEGTWPGLVLIIDMDQSVLAHLGRLELMVLKKVLYFVQECMLVKLKQICFINAPPFVDKLMMLIRPLINKTLMDIIKIHPVGTDTMYKTVPRAAFPKESGGEYKSYNKIKEEQLDRLKSNQDFFQQENKRRVSEPLRPGARPNNVDNIFGIQGSFKKLDID